MLWAVFVSPHPTLLPRGEGMFLFFFSFMTSFQYEHISVAPSEFEARAVNFIAQIMRDAIMERGKCTIGLSGGSTPGPVYSVLGQQAGIDWSKVTLFLVDERYVPASDQQSNQHLVRETLLQGIGSFSGLPTSSTDRLCHAERNEPQRVQTKHKHSRSSAQYDTALPLLIFPNTELLIDECAKDYERRLREHLKDGVPDLLVLGLGEDGHIASLFPGDIDALLEKERWVLPTETEKFAVHNRITVTLPVLAKAERMLFLLRGEEKKKIFAETISSNSDPMEYPAHALLQTGRTTWITGW